MTSGQIVPFGKYKDQPIERIVADDRYCEWLLAQDWFKAKYQDPMEVDSVWSV